MLLSAIFLFSCTFYMANHLLIRTQDGGVFNKMINDKAWKRKVSGRKEPDPIGQDGYERVLKVLKKLDQAGEGKRLKQHDHWITRFMLLPVTIIRAGISGAEIGLHWLLNQRQRNLARISVKNRPRRILLKCLPRRRRIWQAPPSSILGQKRGWMCYKRQRYKKECALFSNDWKKMFQTLEADSIVLGVYLRYRAVDKRGFQLWK